MQATEVVAAVLIVAAAFLVFVPSRHLLQMLVLEDVSPRDVHKGDAPKETEH
jgi:hypothetical protein